MGAPRAQLGFKRGPMYDPRIYAEVVAMVENSCTRTGSGQLTVDIPSLIEKRCGRFSRGKHAGELRGWASWQIVTGGGWLKDGPGYMNGHVVRPGQAFGLQITDFSGKVLFDTH